MSDLNHRPTDPFDPSEAGSGSPRVQSRGEEEGTSSLDEVLLIKDNG